MNLTNYEISQHVELVLQTKKWTVRKCAEAFNCWASEQSIELTVDKDFVQRVKSNKFKIQNDRVLKLCDFLNIPSREENTPNAINGRFKKELKELELLASNEEMTNIIGVVLKDVIHVIKTARSAA
jgi:hypothetical protein